MAIRNYTIYDGEKIPHIRGSKGCFVGGTQISMADGSKKAIEDIQLGDLVLAFSKNGDLGPASVTETFKHENDQFIKLIHWNGSLTLTPNHWVLIEDGLFLEAGKLIAGEDQLVTEDGKISPIDEMCPAPSATSYNFTVSNQHTYIADGIRVHNKGGGGKGGGSRGGGATEAPNDKFSTDMMFTTIGFGEGPVYRINPNGPQDIEIQDGNIDDLINLDGDGGENTVLFKTLTNTGTLTQAALRVFGEEIATPQNFTSPVTLKKGNVGGIPESKIELQDTSAQAWDALRFAFEVHGLINQDNRGNIRGHSAELSIDVFDRTGTTQILEDGEPHIESISGKTNTVFRFDVTILIPEQHRSDDGYKFTIKKTSNDSDSSKIHDEIKVKGWTEIEFRRQAYPRTAHIGYAIKAHSEHVGGVPNFTSMVKGLLVKCPSNYNQPVLENGEIDWRELEVVDGGSTGNSYQENGYSLQFSGPETKLTGSNPQLYVGTWDGTFVFNWTQNPVWIVYDILTNTTYGLGIPEDVIDKFKFFQVAQYCDACNALTGKFEGVSALSDGTFRHKPRGQFTTIRENQFGLPINTKIVERRFICDITISDQGQVMDILNQITSIFRGTLVYNMGKLTLAADLPDELPVAMFNETNIKENSFQISGIKESDIITAVDCSYIEPTNHYKRETVRIDTVDRNDGRDRSALENLSTLDLIGVTRRSQALRYAQYHIAASRFLRRRVEFITSIEAINLAPGDVISVSQQNGGFGLGFGGRIRTNSNVAGGGNTLLDHVHFEYFTEPTIPETFFTANTNPLAMRVYKTTSDRVDLYLLSNTNFSLRTTQTSKQATSTTSITSNANVNFGIDAADIEVTHMFNPIRKTFETFTEFPANAAPIRGDIWMVGEMVNPGTINLNDSADVYTNKAGKLFKVTGINRTEDHEVQIEAIEYVSNVFVDSDEFIDYTPTAYTDILSPFTPPPAPDFQLTPVPRRTSDGSVVIDVQIDPFTDRSDYPLNISTDYFVSLPDVTQKVTNLTSTIGTHPPTFKVGNSAGLADSLTPAILSGKNGASGTIGELRLLCNAVTETGGAAQFVEFTLEGLNAAFDFNFHKHILDVNDDAATFQGLKGIDQISFPALEKANTGAPFGFVGHNPQTVTFSSAILGYNSNNVTSNSSLTSINGADNKNKLVISNPTSTDSTSRLFSKIPSPPFYVTLNQLLDARFYANNSFYVSGTSFEYSRNNTVTLINPVGTDTSAAQTSHIEPLEIVPRDKGFITAFVDGIEISPGSFNLHTDRFPANVEFVSLTSEASTVRVVVDHYTVPAIEVGDNVQFTVGNVFPVIATSYSPGQATNTFTSNSGMTANNIYTITTGGLAPKSNVGGRVYINISPDITGSVGNVSGDSFTLDYDPFTFPATHNLANNGIYDLSLGSDFEQVFLTDDRRLPDVRVGPISVKARNRNFQGRTSPFTVRTIEIEEIPIQKVQGIVITESLFIDRNQGVSVRATVAFDHINNQEVTDYEISYKITGESPDLTTFNTVKVSATGVDNDNKVRFTINNVDRGSSSGVNTLIIRITPLNKEIRGVTAEKAQLILGKTAKPNNIFNLSAGQSTDQVTLFWEYPDPIDLDLQDVVIRRRTGEVANTIANFNIASPLVTVSSGVNRKSVPIDTFGEFTYLARSRDTSGNFSEDVKGFTFTTVEPPGTEPLFAFNEDSPSVNFTSITNTNSAEANYPSFNTSNAGGRFFANKGDGHPSSVVDNSNGTSSGFSALADVDDLLVSGATASYQTQIRDMGTNDFYRVELDFEGTQTVKTTYNDLRTAVQDQDLSEAQTGTPDPSILKAGGLGTLLGTTFNAKFDANNKSLIDDSSSGITTGQNVFAIWNEGQFPGNVISISAITKASTARVTTEGSEHGISTTSSPGTRVIVHDVAGMTDINNKELFAKRINATTVDLFTDSGLTSGLNSSGFDTYTSGGVLDQGDFSNSNSYALIAGVIDADQIRLGNTFLANGLSSSSNNFANVASSAGNKFRLVDLQDYSDSTDFTFDGGGGDVSTAIKMRISTQDNVFLGGLGASITGNGNVNTSQFVSSSTDDGFQAFEAGDKQFRFMQLKFDITNINPDGSDFTLDKIRYKISAQEKTFTLNQAYTSVPTVIDWSAKAFRQAPRVSVSVVDDGNAVFGTFTAISATGGTVKLFKADGSDKAGDGSATINVSAIGV